MEIVFETKEESNKRKEEAFLALSPGERLKLFLVMAEQFQVLPLKEGYVHKNDIKGNFVLTKTR